MFVHILQKLMCRQKQFSSGNIPSKWSIQRRERVKFLLTQGIQYMSSEDSVSDAEDENLYRKPLVWLKKKYRKSLHDLDHLYYNQLSRKAKLMMRKRKDGVYSNRLKPDSAPDDIIDDQHLPTNELNTSNETETGDSMQAALI